MCLIDKLPLLVFDSRNVKALFNVLDIGSRGSITMEQYHEGIEKSHIDEYFLSYARYWPQ
jgi:hypothetical protein